MPARLIQVTILNNSDYPIVWLDDGRNDGFWQEPWYPSNIKNLKPGEQASFRLESGGLATGVDGWALFKVDVPFASNVGVRTEYFRLNFDRAYIETEPFHPERKERIEYWHRDPRTNDVPHPGPSLAFVQNMGAGDMTNMDSSPFEFIPALPGQILTSPLFLLNETFAKHVAWVVEVHNGARDAKLPLKVATKNIIYAVTPRVKPLAQITGGPRPSGGDLMWFRHDGRLDGSFKWEGPEKVGSRWDAFKQVFSGGDGIVYGVTPRVEATYSSDVSDPVSGGQVNTGLTPASGRDLLWYRHVGRKDGSFRWQGPQRVGFRWDVFKHVFSGGDGIIYGIQENGDLMWYRHVGRADGSFLWKGPKKVGLGWGELTQVFSGGDGIIYGVTPRSVAAVPITGGPTQAPGGDLLWFRHLGREDGSFNWDGPRKVGSGWNGLRHLFSDGNGIIYGVTPTVEASILSSVSNLESGGHNPTFTRASGGDLMWYHHIGREAGTFKWEGPKKVGTGWGELEQLFSGGVLSD